jgi:hypothetical protein
MRCPILKNWTPFLRASRRDGAVHEHLMGEVYGDPARPNGTLITTSAVVRRDAISAVTVSGTRYELDGPALEHDAERPRRSA